MSALTIAPIILSSISVLVAVLSFILTRHDKSNKAISDAQKQFDKHNLIEYRLDKIEQNLEKVLNKLDFYEAEIETKVEKALKNHILQYHQK